MPGIQITPWEYREQERKVRRSASEAAFIKFMENMNSFERRSKKELRILLDVAPRTMDRLWRQLQTENSDLNNAMRCLQSSH